MIFRIQHWKRKSAIRLRLCERIEGSGTPKLFQKLINNMSRVQVASNDVASHVFSKKHAKTMSKGLIFRRWGRVKSAGPNFLCPLIGNVGAKPLLILQCALKH